MRSKDRYYEGTATAGLLEKRDCRIENGVIYILTGEVTPRTNDLGNKSWGKIDYLTKYCGYTIVKVHEYPEKKDKWADPGKGRSNYYLKKRRQAVSK